MGWMDGWMDGSLGLVKYRAPYGANKLIWQEGGEAKGKNNKKYRKKQISKSQKQTNKTNKLVASQGKGRIKTNKQKPKEEQTNQRI